MSLLQYRLVCPECRHRATRSEVLDAMMNNVGREPIFACAACGESVVPDFRLKWLRMTLSVLVILGCVAGIFIYPRLLVLWIAAIFLTFGFVPWSMPYITSLKSVARRAT